MKQLRTTLLTIVIIMSLVGIVYYAIPGYSHVFVDNNATAAQPTLTALCFVLFLFSFCTAVQLTPKQSQRCPKCGNDLKDIQTPAKKQGGLNGSL
jgi:hypothetical protein